ncbi:MAG TPA: acetyltransferase [Mucilaginibacter sp.]|jgi:sugar O-acyltransferase (sialic acid O-acetyltransferase NeuD family)
MSNNAVIFGYSGHAYVVIEMLIANHYTVVGYFDNEQKDEDPYQLNYLGNENDNTFSENMKGADVFVGIGNNGIRADVFRKLKRMGAISPSIAHQRSFVSTSAEIGSGTVIMPGVVVNARAKIGEAVICNSSCVIEHECIIGDYVHIAPGAILAGNVTVGDGSFVGANSVIKPGIKIGAGVTIGAGSVVTKNIADGLTVYGNPAKEKKNE